MELWQEITSHLQQSNNIDCTKAFELQCYITLAHIKAVLEDESLNDKDCFQKIEEIVSAFEKSGVKIKARHDF